LSEPRLISPLLDGFNMGDPISDRHGVRSYPAMPQSSDDKYIVKIISIPASQVQLQALLLTGAYPSEEAAGEYFLELAQGVVQEVKVLERLSKMEGFLPFTGCQLAPMEKGVGSQVYLLSPYRPSLGRHLRRSNLTHLAAINLGLDMCASLAVCRQTGYLYADLKPENIFICNDHEFRIGDLGFLKLDSLKYTSLPQRYISPYTAPEVVDAYSDLNATLDIYAAGLILYQVYNGGELPFRDRAGEEPLPPPAYADYELAEIILKACAPDPKDRWQDPIAMGQALVAYMQRNGVNDTPIVAAPEERPQEVFEPEPQEEEPEAAEEALHEEELAPQEEPVSQEIPDLSDLEEGAEAPQGDQVCLDEFYAYFSGDEAEAPVAEATDIEALLKEQEEDPDAELLNLSFLDDLVSDDTAPSEEMAPDIGYGELSDDAFDILAQADDLISHETPEGVVQPEPIEVPMPEPIVFEPEVPQQPQPEAQEEPEPVPEPEPQTVEAPEDTLDDDYEDEEFFEAAEKKHSAKKWIAWCVVLLLLIGLAYGGYVFYKDYYIRHVTSLVLTGSEDELVVSVVADVDEALLTVQCVDTYGGTKTSQVLHGKATFQDLNPNTLYTVKVQVAGMRKLIGDIQGSYTTPVQTNIVSFTAVTGNEPGTAILNFTVDGMDSETWSVTYSAPGEEEKKLIFGGHMANVSGLVSGKTYTFRLDSGDSLYITGEDELVYTAMDPVFAQDLAVTAVTANSLTVSWNVPEGAQVTGWTVRCYSESGYDKTVKTTETTLVFEELNGNEAHTVEVVADGMSTGNRCYMTAGALTVSNIRWEAVSPVSMKLSWDFAGNAPTGAWIITYCGDNADYQEMARSTTNSVTLSPLVPGGSYSISILLEDGTTVFSKPVTLTVPEAKDFSKNFLGREHITAYMCRTPLDVADWEAEHLKDEDYTDTFKPGEKASFLLKASRNYDPTTDVIDIMYVVHDSNGKLISLNIVQQIWRDMWYRRSCELDITPLPEIPGDYQITVYFSGAIVHTQAFHIAE